MAEITHLMNGVNYGVPRNWESVEIEVDWLLKKDSGTINISELEFVEEGNKYLQERIMDGLNGGVGVFEGVPYQIKIGDPGNPVFTFNGYLDMTDDATVIGGEEIVLSLKKRMGEDWLTDVADGFSFAYLYDQGVITDNDFVKVPYVINYIPDGMQLIVLSMAIYMMTKELIENVQKLAETIADATNASTPVVGVSVGLGAGVVTAWSIGEWILFALKAVARIIYLIAIVIAIKKLVQELFDQILQKKRDHLGMTYRRLLEKGCEHLGLSFESDIDELKWVLIPQKTKKGGESGETGFPTNSGSMYTFGDAIRILKKKFNADYRIINNTFIFKRKDKFEFPSTYQMPNFFNDQDRLMDRFKLNTDEMVSNYNIHWAYDVQDQNTLDDDSGRVFQAVTSPIVTQNKEFVVIKNLTEIDIPFSIGREKRGLTDVEELLKSLAGIVDGLTGVFGGGTNFRSKIENRIGSLLLSSHFLTTGKVVVMNGSKLANDQRELVDANLLWEKFHYINSFAEYNGHHNQWIRFEEQRVPMTEKEFSILTENNKATDDQGNEYLIEKIVYVPENTTATIDFRVKRKYTHNLKIEIV